ncbi:MAG: PD-(D/E)XK nuclease-like domain-containing protein [Aminipila sp.]
MPRKMKLTESNYYGSKANKSFFSVSQFKEFMNCEAMALASIRGEYKRPMTRPMLIGSFVDAYFEGTLSQFMNEYPEIFTRKNELRAEFKKANEIIARVQNDPMFMQFLSGDKQRILTFKMFGVDWKMKMDSFVEGICITDLKVVATFKNLHAFRYDIQGAIYQKGVEIALDQHLPFYLAAATKERVTDFDVFQIPQNILDEALDEVAIQMPRFVKVKKGLEEPIYCGKCDYCKSIKQAKIRSYTELMEG